MLIWRTVPEGEPNIVPGPGPDPDHQA
jgi:hypothetical protein